MAEYKISTTISANTSRFKKAIETARETAERFKRTQDSMKDTKLDGDESGVVRAVNKAKRIVKSFDNTKADAELGADTGQAVSKIQSIKKMLNSFSRQKADARADVNIGGAIAKIAALKTALKSIPNRIQSNIIVDEKRAVGAFRSIHRGIQGANDAMDKLANDIRTFGTVFGNIIKGSLLTNISLLVPAIASIVPALMAVLNAAGVVAGGALGMANAFAIAGAGAVGFGAMAISALKMVEDGTLATTKEVQNYQKAVQGLKSAWEGVVRQNQAQIFNTLANGVNTAKVALAGLTPFLSGVAKSTEQASAKMLDWAKNSQVAQKFFKMMGTTGVKVFDNMLSAAGNFGSGLIGILTNLGPLTEWVSKGFANMGRSFNKWANSVAGQKAIQDFTEYVKTNLPLIGQIFGNTFKGIFNLMKAFAPNSQVIFKALADMTSKFEQWSSKIEESDGFKKFIDYVQTNGPKLISLLGNIGRILIAVGVGIAPLAAAFLSVADAVTGFIASIAEANPLVGMLIGVIASLAGVFMMVVPPIVGLVSGIGSLLMAFTGATTIGGALSAVMGALGGSFTALLGPIGIVIGAILAIVGVLVYLYNTNEDVRNFITNAWNGLVSAISGAVQSVIGWFQQLAAQTSATLEPIMPVLQRIGDFMNQVFGKVVMAVIAQVIVAWQTLWTAIQIAATIIGGAISLIVNTIVSLFTALIQFLTGDFSGAWQTLKNMISTNLQIIWQTIVNIWNIIVQFLSNVLNTILGIFGTSWQQIWTTISTYATQIWTTIVTIFSTIGSFLATIWQGIVTVATTFWNILVTVASTIWQLIVTTIVTIVTTLGTILSTIWTGIVTVATTIWTTLVTVASTIWQTLVTVITTVVQSIVSFVTAGWNMLMSVTSSIMSVISSVISSIWQTIVSVISTVVSSIVSFVSSGWSTLMSITSSIMSAISSLISSVWSSIVSFISNAVSNAVNFVRNGWNNMLSAITSAMSAIVSAVMSGMSNVVNNVRNGVNNAVNAARSFIGAMVSAGKDLIMGMINGIKSMAGAIASAAKSVVGNAVNAAKSMLKIGSPSKLFKQFGIWTMEGLGIGINKEGRSVVRDTANVARAMANSFNPQLETPNLSSNLGNINGRIAQNVQHEHSVNVKPSQRVVRIEMDVNNEAIATIVNGVNADNDGAYSF
ncbi:phage tail protein [Staphylococcus ureilyticus]|uniref:phage tail protein n=1 Tax=Staphylococcus ureilyticus TaxID=94138 RepID=UPI003F57889E